VNGVRFANKNDTCERPGWVTFVNKSDLCEWGGVTFVNVTTSNVKERAGKTSKFCVLKPFVSPFNSLSWPSRWAYYNIQSFSYLFMSKNRSGSDRFWLQVCALQAW